MTAAGEIARTGLEIAVIGMSGRFPGARDLETYWSNLKNGIESITFFSEAELAEAGIPGNLLGNSHYVKAKGMMAEVECFDASFFGYLPGEALVMDPQLRLFHEYAWKALEDAGYVPGDSQGVIGLYAGASPHLTWELLTLVSDLEESVDEFSATRLRDKDYLSTRVSYKLNLKGPSVTVQTACSTSLVAIDGACRALLTGICDMALAGGVKVFTSRKSGYLYQEGMVSSPDGHCRAFDARAGGLISGEGVGVVVLKRFEDALADRDHIYCIIRGFAINNDGMEKAGFSAPSVEGQAETIRAALQMAEVEPEQIGCVETHGTATPIGDPVELEALKLAFNSDKRNYCAIGSVKTNIGHLDTAAGAAAIIKAALALKYGQIPPSLHFESPNPKVDFQNSPFYVNPVLKEWTRQTQPRLAGVSSFGIGGTNAHLILEEAPERENTPCTREKHLLLLSAKTPLALDRASQNLAGFLQNNPGLNLADVAYTLQVGRKPMELRRMAVCSTPGEAAALLADPDPENRRTFKTAGENKPVVFMFSGLGSQYVGMGHDLYREEPLFREEMDRCFDRVSALTGQRLNDVLYPTEPGDPGKEIPDFEQAQLVVFIFEYALAKLLLSWGISPRAMIGYSFGEYSAACLAGVLSLEDALSLIVARGKLIKTLPPGSMTSVPLPLQELEPILAGNRHLAAAVDNGLSCIVAGPPPDIAALETELKARKLLCMRLAASHALHSPMMAPIAGEFARAVGKTSRQKPQVPYISNLTGEWLTEQEAGDPHYWSNHLQKTVQFARGIREISKQSPAIFLEIGPGRDLSALIARYLEDSPGHFSLNLVRPPRQKIHDLDYLYRRVGQLWLYGAAIDWDGFNGSEPRSRLPLPTYPFEKNSYWLEGDPFQKAAALKKNGLLGERKSDLADWFYVESWEQSFLTSLVPRERSAEAMNWLVFIDKSGLGRGMATHLLQNGQTVTTVETGDAFAKPNSREYVINHRNRDDFDALFEDLPAGDKKPQKILFFWGITTHNPGLTLEHLEVSQDLGLHSMLYLAQAIGRHWVDREIHLFCVTNHIYKITGEEELYPPKATILGPVQIIPLEYANVSCRCVDIVLPRPGSEEERRLLENLLLEFSIPSPQDFVAYRGTQRWVKGVKPLRLDKPGQPQQRLKKRGVYLITGGFGGMGFTFAEHLARTYQARLILVGRSPVPPRQEWDDWLIQRDRPDRENKIPRKLEKIRELEASGAEIMAVSADVTDLEQMQGVIKKAKERFGPIDGVLHAAGLIDYGGVIQRRSRGITEEYLAPKLRGTLVLDTLFKDTPLDFLVLFSSIGNIVYKRKFAQVSYNAGNEFLEAYAEYKNLGAPAFTTAINWTDWQEVGMTINAFKAREEREKIDLSRELDTILIESVAPAEGVAILERVLEHNLQRVTLATHDLNVILEVVEDLSKKPAAEVEEKEEPPVMKARTPRPRLTGEYVPPRNEREEILEKLWTNFFGLDQAGIHDDFFELGGDSLKATTLIANIHKALHVEIPLPAFFNSPTIAGIAQYIAGANTTAYVSITPAPPQDYYPLSPAQRRIYILQLLEENTLNYNQPRAVILEGRFDRQRLEKVCRQLIRRHESLRTSFVVIDDEHLQQIHENVDFRVEYYGFGHGEAGKDKPGITGTAADEIFKGFVRSFALSQPPLLRVGLIRLEPQRFVLMVDLHHIAADGASNSIFIREFMAAYSGAPLPPLTIQYKDYAVWRNSQEQQEKIKKQQEYWLRQFAGEIPVLNFPTDYPRPEQRSFAGDTLEFVIGEGDTRALRAFARQEGVTLQMLMLALFNVLLARSSGQEDIVVGTSVAERRSTGLENVMGMFANTLALRNFPAGEKSFSGFLKEVKERSLDAYENQDYQFEDLVDLVLERRDTSRHPLFDVLLEIRKSETVTQPNVPGLKVKSYKYNTRTAMFDFDWIGKEIADEIVFSVNYSTRLFKPETLGKMVDRYLEIMNHVLEDKEVKLKDIEISHQYVEASSTVSHEEHSDFEF